MPQQHCPQSAIHVQPPLFSLQQALPVIHLLDKAYMCSTLTEGRGELTPFEGADWGVLVPERGPPLEGFLDGVETDRPIWKRSMIHCSDSKGT